MRLRPLLLALLLPLAAPGGAAARDVVGAGAAAPARNFSNVHDEVDWVQKAFAQADAAADERDWSRAVRLWQEVIDQRSSRESPRDAAPYVRAVRAGSVYEGAWIVARHRIAAGGDEALAAYERELGATAEALRAAATARRDAGQLREVARRFLALPAGRRAALLLVDLALERGDRDEALGWLEALEDLEAVGTRSAAVEAPWRAARIRRQALVMARDAAARPAVEKALAAADPALPLDADPVPVALQWMPPPPTTWPTTGGDVARSAVPAALGQHFHLRWVHGPGDDDGLVDTQDPEGSGHDRPSVWLPPRAVATEHHVFVSDGQYLHVYDIGSGAPVFDRDQTEFPRAVSDGVGEDGPQDRRLRFGLLEGHALSLHAVRTLRVPGPRGMHDLGPGHLLLAAVPDGRPWAWEFEQEAEQARRDDHVQAWFWDGERLEFLWRAGGMTIGPDRPAAVAYRGGLPNDTRLYGAPIVYRGRVWVAGIRPAQATTDRWEAWLYSLDPATGVVATRTHLGTGTPMRSGRMDEVIPTSPAAAHGRVVVSTSLGIVAAVDALDGRVQWIYRYDRDVETERGRRRNRDTRDRGLRTSGFFNEPPILALGRCFVAPTDCKWILSLEQRPRGRERMLLAQDADRFTFGSDLLAEYLAGVVAAPDGRTVLVGVGKGEGGATPGPLVVAREAVSLINVLWPGNVPAPPPPGPGAVPDAWSGHSPTGFGAEPYGRAVMTAEEIFVPQAHGIAVFEIFDRDHDGSHYLGVLDRADMSEAMARRAPERPYGNLIPIPGRGLLAVSATTVAFWEKDD